MEDIVLSYPKLKDRVRGREAERKKVLKNLKELAADFSPATIKTFARFLDATLSQFYDGINLEDVAGLDLERDFETKNLVFVPNHQSHADYVALNYVTFKRFNRPIYIAGGINLNVFPIGTLFRKSGCFFIRRSFASDILYKLTLEAYLYYLLIEGKPIEFFFEGGRSRTGKLLPPRYGLYQMILDAHNEIPEDKRRELLFVPVSIAHEYIPEQKTLTKESEGAKKNKESTRQLLKLYKLLSLQLGSIHIKLGSPVRPIDYGDTKKTTQELAFECSRVVGKNMVVSPTALLAMIMLDEPTGALKWEDIQYKAEKIRAFCKLYNVPLTPSLDKDDQYLESLERALDILIGNKKVAVIGRSRAQHVFYSINEDSRREMLYFKNTIIHHFVIPWVINAAWIQLFSGKINDVADLNRLFVSERNRLKQEFYLPSIKEFYYQGLAIISHYVGREVKTLDECIELSHKELYAIASNIGVFSRSFSYIYEGYYLSAQAIQSLVNGGKSEFSADLLRKEIAEVFQMEKAHGQIIKYEESYSKPLIHSSLDYYRRKGILEFVKGTYKVVDADSIQPYIQNLSNTLAEILKFNMQF